VENRCLACGECRTVCPLGEVIAGSGPLPARNDPCTWCGACIKTCPTGARQMIGRTMTVDEVVAEVAKDRMFYEESRGGVTLSGGEPLLRAAFTTALVEALHAAGTCKTISRAAAGNCSCWTLRPVTRITAPTSRAPSP